MTPGRRTVLFVTSGNWDSGLSASYRRAFEALGLHTEQFDLGTARRAWGARKGPKALAPLLHRFVDRVDPESAHVAANYDLVQRAMAIRPAIVVVICNERVRPATLVALKIAVPDVKLINIYPDPLFNMTDELVACLPSYDLFCAHTRAGIPHLEQLGCRSAFYLPLAADPSLHYPRPLSAAAEREYGCDLVYVGNWRPAHEALFATLEGMNLAIWGSRYWGERTKPGSWVRSRWRGRPLMTGEEYTLAHLAAKVCLNPIDPFCLPGHNQRMFELPACRVFSLVTRSDDARTIFREGETIACFDSSAELVEKVRHYLERPEERTRIAGAAHELVVHGGHTYVDRVKTILERLGIAG